MLTAPLNDKNIFEFKYSPIQAKDVLNGSECSSVTYKEQFLMQKDLSNAGQYLFFFWEMAR